ncbi:MAG: carboxypeptidase-like regulatory domain-containing protein [Acidobacteriota bacterium]
MEWTLLGRTILSTLLLTVPAAKAAREPGEKDVDSAQLALRAVEEHFEANSQDLSGVVLSVADGPVLFPDHWRWHEEEQNGPSRLRVRLVQHSGAGVPECPARVVAEGFEQRTVSDPGGRVEFNGVPAGKATLQVRCQSWKTVDYQILTRPSEKRSFELKLFEGSLNEGYSAKAPELSGYQALPKVLVLVKAEGPTGLQLLLVLLHGEQIRVFDNAAYSGRSQPLAAAEWEEMVEALRPFYDAFFELGSDPDRFSAFVSEGLKHTWSRTTGVTADLMLKQLSRYLLWNPTDVLRRAEHIGEKRTVADPDLTPQEESERAEENFLRERERIRQALEEKGAWNEEHLASFEPYLRLYFGEGLIRKVSFSQKAYQGSPLEWLRGKQVYQTRILPYMGLYFARIGGLPRIVAMVIHD